MSGFQPLDSDIFQTPCTAKHLQWSDFATGELLFWCPNPCSWYQNPNSTLQNCTAPIHRSMIRMILNTQARNRNCEVRSFVHLNCMRPGPVSQFKPMWHCKYLWCLLGKKLVFPLRLMKTVLPLYFWTLKYKIVKPRTVAAISDKKRKASLRNDLILKKKKKSLMNHVWEFSQTTVRELWAF